MSAYQDDPQMSPVIGGAGAPYSAPPTQEAIEVPPVIGGAGSSGEPPTMRDNELPPVLS